MLDAKSASSIARSLPLKIRHRAIGNIQAEVFLNSLATKPKIDLIAFSILLYSLNNVKVNWQNLK